MGDDGHFGEAVAAGYDDDEHAASDSALLAATVGCLSDLAGGGRVLEFAIGTGRVALPLAARGVWVAGLDSSRPMLDRLRAKPGGAVVDVTFGDMTTTRVAGTFSLVYLIFNTISNLTTQSAQVDCFRNAAAHLAPGGRFLIEVMVPPLQRLAPGETLLAFERSESHWGIDEIDVVSQCFTSHHLRKRKHGLERRSIPFRYVWPSELDLMARLAGLSLSARWGDWYRGPFTAGSASHISVWEKPVD